MHRYSTLAIAILVVLLYFCCPTQGQCDLTQGCYPSRFSITNDIGTFPARSIVVSSTCGVDSPTEYYNIDLTDSTEYTCIPSEVSADKMVDADETIPQTYWQSSPLIPSDSATAAVPQTVEFHFGDEFLFYEVEIRFIVPHGATPDNSADARPAKWSVEKLADDTWVPLQHFARDCGRSFPDVPVSEGFPSTTVDCIEYLPPENGFYDEDNWITYYPGQLDVFRNLYKNDTAVADYFTTSAIRLVFLEPAVSSPALASYVTVGSVVMGVVCKCNGHADTCLGDNEATCDCQHFTTGKQCDQCQPLYNERLPVAGTTSSAGECQVCSCNDHATSCHFDPDKNYGVCDSCQDNTAGDFCDTCATGFYVNSTWTPNNGEYCLPCQCNQEGTLSTGLVTCLVGDGQCSCKDNVMLRDCSECKDGFFGLSAEKDQGCTECNCDPAGTLGEENLCDKSDGTCLCRANVEGTTCDRCKALTYGFDASIDDGCFPCDCDPGASSDLLCNVDSGQCTCRSNIEGRDCRRPSSGYYVPRMDMIIIEPEDFASPENVVLRPGHGTQDATVSGRGLLSLTTSNSFQTTITPEFSGPMDIAIRYEKVELFIRVDGSLVLSGSGYTCGDQDIADNTEWSLTTPVTTQDTRGTVVLERVCLQAGSSYTLTLTTPGAQYWIDSIIFVPDVESVKATLSGHIEPQAIDNCRADAISRLRQNRESCAYIEYSVMAALLDGAVACSCSSGSLVDSSCDPLSGDCNCRTGALPPHCELCKTEFYGFSEATGCTACSCDEDGSRKQNCSETGVCDCRDNVEGDKCDVCLEEFYGLNTGEGCQECQCNPTYSQNNRCDDFGQCLCQPGVGGQNCEGCDHGYFNLTPEGCTICQCEPLGSTEEACNQVTGECQCLDNAEGHTCDRCKDGHFGLGSWHPGGCIPCFCWDKSNNCTSLANYANQPIVSGLSGVNFDGWTAAMEDGTDVGLSQSTAQSDGQTVYTLTFALPNGISQAIYYNAPSSFYGDRSSAYGRQLTIGMSISSPQDSGLIPIRVMIEGQFFDNPIIYMIEFDATQTRQTFQIPVQENEWNTLTDANTGATEATTFNDMMAVLYSVSALKIQAYTVDFPGLVIDLNSVRLDNAEESQGGDINNIENCYCQEGYTGNHCQSCAPGYKRPDASSNRPDDECVLCQCNQHEDGPCDPVTGVCSCTHNTEGDQCDVCVTGYYGDATAGSEEYKVSTHNTEGDQCDVCVTGYYGDATVGSEDDCLPCACPGSIPANAPNVFAQSCFLNEGRYPVCEDCQEGHTGDHCELCVDGYFGTPENASNAGGACVPCECNGRADTCNTRTGECIDCRQNTTGHTCEICASGFYGDAMNAACEECVCKNLNGSTGECDPTTGICECHPNVEGLLCDTCVDETFNLVAGQGCEPCNCFETGSTNQLCDKVNGQCTCHDLVQGRQCNECQASYWNINEENGCDACSCNATGTAKEGNATIESCDLVTGQCQCALEGISGRQCDVCSPVTTYNFHYVQLFYLGTFPQCELCGECFDSWGIIIDDLGREVEEVYSNAASIWSKYDNQTAEAVASELNSMEENINIAEESVIRFGQIAQDLQILTQNFLQAISQNDQIDSKVSILSQTKLTLQTSFASVEALTALIQLSEETSTTLESLHSNMNRLMEEINLSVQRGNSSWRQIESLAFVVAPPEEREAQLVQQAERSMSIASLANSTLQFAVLLYETSLSPGVANAERQLSNADASEREAMATYESIQGIIADVAENITVIEGALQSLETGSETARTRMLQAVTDLREHLTNASSMQIKLSEVETLANDFLAELRNAEDTVTNAMLSILENIAAINQAQSDLIRAGSLSTNVLSKQFRSTSELEVIIEAIGQTAVSEEDVEALNLEAQKALFEANEAVTETQQALGLAREVKQEVDLMQQDIENARNLQVQAQGLRNAAVAETNTIQGIIDQANSHISATQEDIASLTSSVENVQDDIKTVSSCLTQAEISVSTATESADGAESRSQAAISDQQTLLDVMLLINEETRDQSSADTLVVMTTANTIIDQVVEDANDVMNITDIEVLLQDLKSQNSQIESLEADIDQLTSTVNQLLLALEESVGENACSSNVP